MILWNEVSLLEQAALLTRPAVSQSEVILDATQQIITRVKENGDQALRELAAQFDQRDSARLQVPVDEIKQSGSLLSAQLKSVIEQKEQAQKPSQ